jgi:hypothetical protein
MIYGNPLSFPIVSLKDGSVDKLFQSKTRGEAAPGLASRQPWECAQSSLSEYSSMTVIVLVIPSGRNNNKEWYPLRAILS